MCVCVLATGMQMVLHCAQDQLKPHMFFIYNVLIQMNVAVFCALTIVLNSFARSIYFLKKSIMLVLLSVFIACRVLQEVPSMSKVVPKQSEISFDAVCGMKY